MRQFFNSSLQLGSIKTLRQMAACSPDEKQAAWFLTKNSILFKWRKAIFVTRAATNEVIEQQSGNCQGPSNVQYLTILGSSHFIQTMFGQPFQQEPSQKSPVRIPAGNLKTGSPGCQRVHAVEAVQVVIEPPLRLLEKVNNHGNQDCGF